MCNFSLSVDQLFIQLWDIDEMVEVAVPETLYLHDKMPMGEDDMTEFKQSFSVENFDTYRRALNGFLNSKGGVLYFGVRDNGVINGLTNNGKQPNGNGKTKGYSLDKFKLWVDQTQNQLFKPAVNLMTVIVYKLTRDLAVWAIKVNPYHGKTRVFYQKCAYKRLNASTVLMFQQDILTPNELSQKMQEINKAQETKRLALTASHEARIEALTLSYEAKLAATAAKYKEDLWTANLHMEEDRQFFQTVIRNLESERQRLQIACLSKPTPPPKIINRDNSFFQFFRFF